MAQAESPVLLTAGLARSTFFNHQARLTRPDPQAGLKLMNVFGLVCKVRRPRRYRSWLGRIGTTAENILNRRFSADAPDTPT